MHLLKEMLSAPYCFSIFWEAALAANVLAGGRLSYPDGARRAYHRLPSLLSRGSTCPIACSGLNPGFPARFATPRSLDIPCCAIPYVSLYTRRGCNARQAFMPGRRNGHLPSINTAPISLCFLRHSCEGGNPYTAVILRL